MTAYMNSSLPDLTLISKGKVRDIYGTSSPDHLLFVASDRISVYDVILQNVSVMPPLQNDSYPVQSFSFSFFQGIPDKGKLLTEISLFWFNKLHHVIPNHLVTANIDEMPEEIRKYKDQLDGRAMLVRRAQVIPLEAIVRGYLVGASLFFGLHISFKSHNSLGSAWSEYKKSGTVHGIPMPVGLVDGQKLAMPLFTPSTKAEQGAHDENISPEQGRSIDLPSPCLSKPIFFSCQTDRSRPVRQNIFGSIEVIRRSGRLCPSSRCNSRRHEVRIWTGAIEWFGKGTHHI